MKREAELQTRPLGDGWVEIRMVYRVETEIDNDEPASVRGPQAIADIVHFVIAFAAAIASNYGVFGSRLAGELMRLNDHVRTHHADGCSCRKTTKH